jgi:hypothetical protein
MFLSLEPNGKWRTRLGSVEIHHCGRFMAGGALIVFMARPVPVLNNSGR